MTKRITDDEFIRFWRSSGGSPTIVSRKTGLSESNVYSRRRGLVKKGVVLKTQPLTKNSSGLYGWAGSEKQYPLERNITLENGRILCISDAHYWPGIVTTAHVAAVEWAKQEQPEMIAVMGDMFDGATVSRHPPLGWEKLPRVIDELDACRQRISEFEFASPYSMKVWHIGNHDARFDRCLVGNASQYEGLEGFSICDYFKAWEFTYLSNINNQLGLRHRPVNGGVHSAYNSAMKYGMSYAHGHLHQLKVSPVDNATGRLWGVDCGHLADPKGPQFAYREGLSIGACSGFAVITLYRGIVVDAEICTVNQFGAFFRGEMIVSCEQSAEDEPASPDKQNKAHAESLSQSQPSKPDSHTALLEADCTTA
jgi:hypothetical protein